MSQRIGKTIGASSLVMMGIGAAGARIEVLPPLVGFYVFLLGALAGGVAVLWGLVSFLRRRDRSSVVIAALGLPAVIIIAVVVAGNSGAPSINDISTDLNDPPALSIAPEYPSEFKEIARAHYGDLHSLVVQDSADQSFAVALDHARAHEGWHVSDVDPEKRSFEAYSQSAVFRFRDDVVVRVRAHQAGATIDMRSRSRVGRSDLGVNARRIRSFFSRLAQSLTPLPSSTREMP